jgi:hypothetical protein
MPPAAIQDAPGPVSAIHKGFGAFLKKAKVVAHYGFVPLVLYLGFQTDPQPSLIQLFLPI